MTRPKDELSPRAELVIMFIFNVLTAAVLIAWLYTTTTQGNRDSRRLDVIERQLNIPGPDVATPTIQDLLATIQAERGG